MGLRLCLWRQVISFNLGSLGFLTNHLYKNYVEDLTGVIHGRQDLGHCSIDGSVRFLLLGCLQREFLLYKHPLELCVLEDNVCIPASVKISATSAPCHAVHAAL